MRITPGILSEMARRIVVMYHQTNHPMLNVMERAGGDEQEYVIGTINDLTKDWGDSRSRATAGIIVTMDDENFAEVSFQESVGFLSTDGDWYLYDE